jgi:hypothetical protein
VWQHVFVTVTQAGLYTVYFDGVSVHSQTVSTTFPTGTTMDLAWIKGITRTGHLSWKGSIDDIRVFNTDTFTAEDIGALANSQYDASRLLLRMEMQDATDTQGNYGGTENGSCIDTTRYKYGAKSLTSDGVTASTKYLEMPAVPLVTGMGLSFSLWFYNEAGLSTGDSMLFESYQDSGTSPRLYVTQYKNDRTKFRFSDNASCIVYAATGSWHKMVITITSGDEVNIWVDDSHDIVGVTETNIMPDAELTAGWRIGRNITNLANLCSFGGSIAEFKVWNRVLTATEAVAVA